jgi:hypothetical protein
MATVIIFSYKAQNPFTANNHQQTYIAYYIDKLWDSQVNRFYTLKTQSKHIQCASDLR